LPLLSVVAVLTPVLPSSDGDARKHAGLLVLTVPVITPVRLCAAAGTAIARRRRRRNAFFRFFMILLPSSSLADREWTLPLSLRMDTAT
jgi:hypothetical protein